jgi:hypothetical protein
LLEEDSSGRSFFVLAGSGAGATRKFFWIQEPALDHGRTELSRLQVSGGLTREVETPLPSNSPRDHMVLRVDLVGSHGRWKRPCLQTAHMTI